MRKYLFWVRLFFTYIHATYLWPHYIQYIHTLYIILYCGKLSSNGTGRTDLFYALLSMQNRKLTAYNTSIALTTWIRRIQWKENLTLSCKIIHIVEHGYTAFSVRVVETQITLKIFLCPKCSIRDNMKTLTLIYNTMGVCEIPIKALKKYKFV